MNKNKIILIGLVLAGLILGFIIKSGMATARMVSYAQENGCLWYSTGEDIVCK